MTVCWGCRHLRIEPDRDGKIRLRRDRAYPCTFPVETIRVPASTVRTKGEANLRTVIGRMSSHMEPFHEHDCSLKEDV